VLLALLHFCRSSSDCSLLGRRRGFSLFFFGFQFLYTLSFIFISKNMNSIPPKILIKTWKEKTIIRSGDFLDCPEGRAVLKIPNVGPLLLEDLAADSDNPWAIFEALRAIYRESGPKIPESHRGHLNLVKRDWLEWGKKRGLL
jgi:hypothetical protein